MNAEALVKLFAARGVACEIEAGRCGLVVYASTRVDAERVAEELARSARLRDPRARVPERAQRDEDEPAATAWWAAVNFDWRRF